MSLEKSLKRISLWGKVFGIILIIAGVLYLPFFLVGLLYIFPGYFLYKAGDAAGKALQKIEDEESKEDILHFFAKFLFSQVIVAGVSIVLFIIFFFLMFVVGMA